MPSKRDRAKAGANLERHMKRRAIPSPLTSPVVMQRCCESVAHDELDALWRSSQRARVKLSRRSFTCAIKPVRCWKASVVAMSILWGIVKGVRKESDGVNNVSILCDRIMPSHSRLNRISGLH